MKSKRMTLAYIATFNVTVHEMKLDTCAECAYFLDVTRISGISGTKTGSREIFRNLGLDLPYGFENLKDENEIADALAKLKINNPHLGKGRH
jgi:hypothetical protein